MITILIFIIGGIIIANIITYDRNWSDFFDHILATISGGLTGLLCGIIMAFMLPMKTELKITHTKIECLQDNGSIRGNFFLGSGNINGEMKYAFYTNENGYFKLKTIKCEDVKIMYSNVKPVIYRAVYEPVDVWWNGFGIDTDIFCEDYVILVPKGSIQNNYNLDAK